MKRKLKLYIFTIMCKFTATFLATFSRFSDSLGSEKIVEFQAVIECWKDLERVFVETL